MSTYEKAKAFVYRQGRALDWARWRFHLEGGSRADVMEALGAYQNADGGFGHGLEPDAWNPNSTPIQTWAATEVLHEIGWTDAGHEVVQGILRYLGSEQDWDGARWYNAVVSNRAYPHAPWWATEVDSADSYNPTACLAGFLLRFAERGSALFALGARVAREAVEADDRVGLSNDMHSVLLYIRLLEYCEAAGVADVVDLGALRERLRLAVKATITPDVEAWSEGYVCKPSQLLRGRESVFYADNRELADRECEVIVRSQLADGSWPVPWAWAGFAEEWPVARTWWKGQMAVNYVLYLRGMGRLE